MTEASVHGKASPDLGTVCAHGSLKRQCRVCELEAEVTIARTTEANLHEEITKRDGQLKALMDAIFPKRPPEWTAEQLATLATAHREDSDTVDELEKAGADEDVPYAECVRRLRERLAALEQDCAQFCGDNERLIKAIGVENVEQAIKRITHNHDLLDSTLMDRRKLEQARDAIQETLTAVEFEVALVYCHITNNRISKCNTLASVVISEADELAQKDIDEAVAKAEARVAALTTAIRAAMAQSRRKDGAGRPPEEAAWSAVDAVLQNEVPHTCMACPVEVRDLHAVLHNLCGAVRRLEDDRVPRLLAEAYRSLARFQNVVDAHFAALQREPGGK